MSEMTIAACWKYRSLLRASAGGGRPRGARYSVKSRHSRGAQAHPEHSLELLQRIARLLDVGDLLEPEDARVELGGSIHVGNCETDAAHLADERQGIGMRSRDAAFRSTRDQRREGEKR